MLTLTLESQKLQFLCLVVPDNAGLGPTNQHKLPDPAPKFAFAPHEES